jgi:acyl dehydratase
MAVPAVVAILRWFGPAGDFSKNSQSNGAAIVHVNGRTFDWNDQKEFARISCDYNPMHMDPKAARRTYVGAPIVHGIHSLIWLLDCLARSDLPIRRIKTIKAQFLQPIYVGDDVAAEIVQTTPRMIRTRITIGPEEVMVATLGLEQNRKFQPVAPAQCSPMTPPQSPHGLELEQMANLSGRLSAGPAIGDINKLFPAAAAAFGLQSVVGLVCSSCLVGMLVPGLHSIFSGLEISLEGENTVPPDMIDFVVQSVVPRFRLVRIDIAGPGLQGSLETINRMPPTRQPDMKQLASQVGKGEFADARALVVGGSRGLGELTAKLIAAGGGEVTITYASGQEDAERTAQEIKACAGACSVIPYDVHRPAAEQLVPLQTPPTHLYYYSTPAIFRRKAGLFDAARFAEFNTFYISAFFDLVLACARQSPSGINVFYPSSTAIDHRPATMTEYSMSKAAAEILCADLSRFLPGVRVLTRRLPRLPTDQTASTIHTEAVDPVSVLLPIIREMHLRRT